MSTTAHSAQTRVGRAKGHKCSQLNWESKGITLFTAGADAQIDDDRSVKGSVNFGTGGNGHIVNTDRLSPGHDDWSDRSNHPNTDLCVAGAIELDRIIYSNETSSITIGPRLRNTDVQWTAYGGSGTHSSEDGFRDQPVVWADREIRNSYRQKVPVSFIGLSGHQAIGDLRIRGGIQGDLSLGIRDIDDHFGGPALSDDMDPAPAIGASVAVNYALTPGASLYLSGSFERVFHNCGKMEIRDMLDGTRLPWTKDEAGANFEAISISLGLKGSF
ncbi:omptin family outer membrane protease [Sinorhizobium sp. P24N7]|uniref:omptin family outer membrane protease n=1 Tax=Sinorhizobium sp. P24N7 TaxID=3348358 RepID=UPI0036D2EB67